jgi:ribosomal-protein-alanine N-acetyltransferase
MPAPWSEHQLRAELDAANAIGWVVKGEGGLVGYAFFRTCPPECELLHLVVAPGQRRGGAAQALLQQALRYFIEAGITSCLLEVRDSNVAARSLYAKMGFHQVGRRTNYYRQPVEDALLMSRDLMVGNEGGLGTSQQPTNWLS